MLAFLSSLLQRYYQLSDTLSRLATLMLATARLYVAWVFFKAGLTKLRDWDTTLFLFEEEYSVPLLNYELAAYLATAGEIILPVLLALGLASRFGAIGLFVVNLVAVISLEEIAPAALYLHYLWGILLLQIVIWGGGTLSIDTVFHAKRIAAMRHKLVPSR